jgi:hypothetical protein
MACTTPVHILITICTHAPALYVRLKCTSAATFQISAENYERQADIGISFRFLQGENACVSSSQSKVVFNQYGSTHNAVAASDKWCAHLSNAAEGVTAPRVCKTLSAPPCAPGVSRDGVVRPSNACLQASCQQCTCHVAAPARRYECVAGQLTAQHSCTVMQPTARGVHTKSKLSHNEVCNGTSMLCMH